MKYLKNIRVYVAAALALILGSCSEDQFLTENNPNAMTEATFWKNATHAQAGLTAVYGALQYRSIGGDRQNLEMAMGDLTGSNYWTFVNVFSEYKFTDNNQYVAERWSEPYIGIYRANQVIDKVEAMSDDLFDAAQGYSKNQIIAEAKFLRAFFYWRVVQTFGKAVITLHATGRDEDLYIAPSSIEAVNEQVIVPDLMFAREHLPKQYEASQKGRVTWGAATALLGKVRLFDENWTEAKSLFKELIDAGIYSLTPEIGDNFRHDTEFNSESIFEIAFETNTNPGISAHNVDNTPYAVGAEATALARMCASWGGGGWANTLPTYFIHELLLNDTVPSGGGQSARLSASIAPRDGEGLYYGKTMDEMKLFKDRNWGFGESAYIKKYTNWYWTTSEDPQDRSGINFRVIRYADVLLMYAEAVLMADGDAGVDEAVLYIDQVRERAGVVTLADYRARYADKFPQFHVSKELNVELVDGEEVFVEKEQPLVKATAENVLMHLKMVERPQEFCFEGQRFRDLRRWGMVKQVLEQHRADELLRVKKYSVDGGAGDGSLAPLFIDGSVRQDFVQNYKFFKAESHSYLPIPTRELQTNEAF